MSKVAIVYWSGTGNTEAMAKAVADGAKVVGSKAEIIDAKCFNESMVDGFDAIGFGCPPTGSEVLEKKVFRPMFDDCKSKLIGKKIALFGSYGGGDGEWMRNWNEECESLGADIVAHFVICSQSPNEACLKECIELGKALA
ncbi:MAG: flavodoxin domain-containing protein [Lachnospiraceae bacterium]|nr:flavodoxin domain-containing protein [Lachnospiraceae bacterium]